MGNENLRGIGMGWSEAKDQSLSTAQLRNKKMQNWESAEDLDAAAENIAQGMEGLSIEATGAKWQSAYRGEDGELRWMLE